MALLALSTTGRIAQAQDPAKPTPVRPMARDADPDWEVATVKASDPNDTRGQHIDFAGRHVAMPDTTVEQFLLMGYGVQKSQIAGAPDWIRTERWNVNGIPDAEGIPNWPQTQALMRRILAERFGLILHHEQRELPVFALTVAKGGPRMTASDPSPNGWMDQQNYESNGRHGETLKHASMTEFVGMLQFHVNRPIVDQTGLKGFYDLKLKWTLDDAAPSSAPDAPPGLFTAIQEQVGLRLDPVKAPADVLVIDKVERPGAN